MMVKPEMKGGRGSLAIGEICVIVPEAADTLWGYSPSTNRASLSLGIFRIVMDP